MELDEEDEDDEEGGVGSPELFIFAVMGKCEDVKCLEGERVWMNFSSCENVRPD